MHISRQHDGIMVENDTVSICTVPLAFSPMAQWEVYAELNKNVFR